jgi:hypothetical protein
MTNKKFWLGMLVMVLVFGMTVVGCDNDNGSTNATKSIDSRLVGGKWYDGSTGTQNIYYRFTQSDFITTINGATAEVVTAAYSENGQVKASANGTVLLNYVFVPASEYDDKFQAAMDAGDQILAYKWDRMGQAAKSGNMVRFTVSGITVDWARWENVN